MAARMISLGERVTVRGKTSPPAPDLTPQPPPGTRSRHYAPRAQVLLVEQGAAEAALKELSGKRVGVLVYLTRSLSVYGEGQGEVRGAGGEVIIIQMPRSLKAYARRLFAALRELDEQGVDVIVVEKLQERGLGRAIMDRLRRASSA
jgi:L-threonylcarbamoyladenylate synthase